MSCLTTDPMYPTGCPAGFSPHEMYYAQNVTVLIGAGLLGLFMLDGWAKLIAAAFLAWGVGVGYQVQASPQSDGSIKCVVTGTSSW